MAQLIKAVIDTQKNSYRSIGQVNAADDLELELEVKMNGQPIEFINPECELLIKKSDNNKVRQTKDILYQDGKFKIKVDEQGVTYPGIVTCQLVTKEDGRVSTCLFYFMVSTSLDREVLQSISKVEVLEQLEEYIVTAFANLKDFEEKVLSSDETIRKLNYDMNESEKIRDTAELQRQETFKSLKENMNEAITNLESSINLSNMNEKERSEVFNSLKSNLESIKQDLINLNASVESEEEKRVQAEINRVNKALEIIEKLESTNNSVATAEAERVSEFNKIKTENNTLKEALTTINNTANSNEEVRKENETSRVEAEKARVNEFNTMKLENETFKQEINEQYETIEKKVNDHIESCSGGATSIDDTTISTDRTWSSAKIEDFVHTNDDVVWSTVQGENLSIDYTKEGYLREVEIWGNTWQDDTDSKNLFDKDNINLLKETVNEATSYIVEGNTVKFEIPNSGNQFKFRIRLDRKLDISKSYKISYSSYRAFVNGEWITSGIVEGSQSIEEGNIFNVSFIKDWLPITKFEVTNLQIEEGEVATSYEPYHKADLSNIQHLGELYADEEGNPILDSDSREQYKIEIESRNFYNEEELLTSTPKAHKTTLLLPCQLMKVGDVADRLYWDNEKGKYVVEKKVDIPEGYNQLIDETLVLETSQLIETNITKEILVPCYKDKTHLFVTGGIDGTIKAKIPLDGGQAIQSLSVMNLALNEEVSTLSLENEELKSTNDTQDELINTTMLATDEMYMMIEPLLSEAVQTLSLERSVSKMVDMYVAMVQRGLKTIDEVPARYREQVKEILAQLEK